MRAPLILSAMLIAAVASGARAQCTPAIQKLSNDQKYDEAKAEVQALLRKNDKDDAALHCMGRIFMDQDRSPDAIEWFEKAVKANDQSSAHHLWLGNSIGDRADKASKLRQPFLARRIKGEFDKAAQLDPTSIDARHGLIQFYSQAPGFMGGSMDKAKDQAREIAKLNAMRGHIEMGALLERDKDIAGAEKEFAAALAASAPDSNAAYYSNANFFRRQKRYGEAVAMYEAVLKKRPDLTGMHLNIAWALTQQGQNLDRAEHETKEFFAAPKDASNATLSFGHFIVGTIYEKQGKKDAARAAYQEALKLNPNNPDAKKSLEGLK